MAIWLRGFHNLNLEHICKKEFLLYYNCVWSLILVLHIYIYIHTIYIIQYFHTHYRKISIWVFGWCRRVSLSFCSFRQSMLFIMLSYRTVIIKHYSLLKVLYIIIYIHLLTQSMFCVLPLRELLGDVVFYLCIIHIHYMLYIHYYTRDDLYEQQSSDKVYLY